MKQKREKLKVMILAIVIIYTTIISCLTHMSPLIYINTESSSISEDYIFTTMTRGWSVTEVLSNESVTDAHMPKMVVDHMGNVHVVWYDSNPSEFAYRLWNATLKSWAPVEEVSLGLNGTSSAPALAVDGGGHLHVTWVDTTDYSGAGGDYDIFYARRNATTGNWTPVLVVSNISTGMSGSPAIAVDASSNAHVVWDDDSAYNGSGSDLDILYRMWNATTDTWTATQVISINRTNFSDNPSIAEDYQGNVHIVWYEMESPLFNSYYRYRNASTRLWSPIELISTESQGNTFPPRIAADLAGHLHVVWYEDGTYNNSGSDEDIIYKRRNATTGNWTIAEVVSVESGWNSLRPAIITDYRNNCHVVWGESLNGIFYKYWNATSGAWTPMEEVSTESTGVFAKPTIAVDPAGYVHIAWEDRSNYSGAGIDFDIFYKKTLDLLDAPILAVIVPNPNFDGNISLNWSSVTWATSYYVYRDTSPITSIIGLSPIQNVTNTIWNDTISINGQYYYAVVAGNATHNSSLSNCESVLVQLPDTKPPQYSNVVEARPSPQNYTANQLYQFNLTITEEVGLGTVFLEWNGTNSTVSTHEGDVYYYELGDLGAGTYQYRWIFNDTSNNWNATLLKPYLVNKINPNMDLLLNGTPANHQTNGTWYCNLTITFPLGDTVYLYLNESLLDAGLAPLVNVSQFMKLGMYNVTAWYPGGANYSAMARTHWLTVRDGIPPGPCNLTIVFPYPPNFVLESTPFEIWGGTDLGEGISHYQYQIDVGGWLTGANFTLAGISNGPHVISYRAGDASGNNGTTQNMTVYLLENTADYDQDGLTNAAELNIYGTNIFDPDTDGDGLLDGEEIALGANPLDPLNPLLDRLIFFISIIGGAIITGIVTIRVLKHTNKKTQKLQEKLLKN